MNDSAREELLMQVDAETLSELRRLARKEKRELREVIEEAFQALIAQRRRNPLNLYTLEDACGLFPSEIGITAKDLKKEARRGRLAVIKVSRKEFVSEQAIREMLAVCQEKSRPRVSGSDLADPTENQSGSSLTPEAKSALAALKEQSLRLRGLSPDTSRQSMKRRGKVEQPPR
ncbi:hypothetical protein [Rhodomicrobium udaipurense]|uniref:Uncharacterized protein n=1 Tax=Rhodomicrobium udaipurense TaxID=1202716 RepID=A0A8I1KLB9_9HYPH|nr:hypothetical protein [Rhodomicrobium udaipurense]MBJ7545169.1 hypothetical protein [Rhodomicrobium udaipurense]